MIEIPTKEIPIKTIPLERFDRRRIKIITKTVWDVNTGDFYADRADFEKSTGQDIGYRVEADSLGRCNGRVYQIGGANERVNIVLACRCGFGVFEYEGQHFMFPKLQLYEQLGLMAYQALAYKGISTGLVKYLSDSQNRKITKYKLGSELYLKVIMSLGIVNAIDYEDSQTPGYKCRRLTVEAQRIC